MRFPQRRKVADVPPGVTLKVHIHRDLETLLNRDLAGSLVIIDRRDLDSESAHRLLDARPHTVINASQFISGRFANLGPEILAGGGVRLYEAERVDLFALVDGCQLRLHEATLYDGAVVAADLNELVPDQVQSLMTQARAGLIVQLETFAHTTSEFLRREEDLLLHGRGLPDLRTKITNRPVVVIGPAARVEDLKPLRAYLREQRPVVIAVDAGAQSAVSRGLKPDVVILSGAGTVQPRTLARCREVILTGSGEAVRRRAEQANVTVHEVQTRLSGLDLGLLIGDRAGAKVLIPVGYPASLDEFIDRGRSVQASNVLTRLRVGANLVEGSAIPQVYSGRARRWHVGLAMLTSAIVLAVTVATTPVGQDWVEDARDRWESVR